MTPVLVVGGGGHARVSVEVLRACGFEPVGCLTRDGVASATLDVPVIGRDADLEARLADTCTNVFVAVGHNGDRLALAARVRAGGGVLVSAVSPAAVLSPSVLVGDGTLVMPGAVVNAGTVLGEVVIVNTNAGVDHDCEVRDGAHIAPGVAVAGGVTVGRGAMLGIGSCVIPGVTVGDHAVVGAGAAVVRDVAPGDVVVGVPARPVRTS